MTCSMRVSLSPTGLRFKLLMSVAVWQVTCVWNLAFFWLLVCTRFSVWSAVFSLPHPCVVGCWMLSTGAICVGVLKSINVSVFLDITGMMLHLIPCIFFRLSFWLQWAPSRSLFSKLLMSVASGRWCAFGMWHFLGCLSADGSQFDLQCP